MVFEHINVPMVTVPELGGHDVEQMDTLHSEGSFPGFSYICRVIQVQGGRDSLPACPTISRSESDGIALNKTLRDLPNEDDYISLTSSFLTIQVQGSKLLPITAVFQPGVFYL